jgi:ABC-type glycerol-3-phosphate transport system substrate-binding protein
VAVVPFPAGSTGRSVTPVSGSGLAVFNGTPSVSAADTLAEFLSDARAQTAMLYGAGSLPALRSVLSSTQVTTNPVREVFARALLTAKSLPSIEQSTNLLPPLSGALRSTLTGQKLPQPAMSAVAESYLSLFQGWSLP